MRALLILLVVVGLATAVRGADTVDGRVVKVLPLLLDLKGRAALSPSLFDRDAYQALLREQATNVSALRFDVLWRATKAPAEKIKIDVEIRGIGTNSIPKLQTLETNVVPGTFRRWTYIPFGGEAYRNFGRVVAWRVTLWDEDRLLSEQKSFLW
jgi:hypothetical protein